MNQTKSLNGGEILYPDFKVGSHWTWKTYAESKFFDNDKPLEQYTSKEMQILLYGAGNHKVTFTDFSLKYEGLIDRFTRMYIKKDVATMTARTRAIFEQYVTQQTCPVCHGARLNQVESG